MNRHSFPQIAAEASSVMQSQKVMKNAEKLLKSSASPRIANGAKAARRAVSKIKVQRLRNRWRLCRLVAVVYSRW